MSKLINSLAAGQKTAYQTYTLEHGIERVSLLVPVKQSALFETLFAKLSTRSKKEVLSLLEQVGGKVKG